MSAEPAVEEWVEDERMQLATLKLEPAAQAAFVMDHLSGNARQKILGSGIAIRNDPSAKEKLVKCSLSLYVSLSAHPANY